MTEAIGSTMNKSIKARSTLQDDNKTTNGGFIVERVVELKQPSKFNPKNQEMGCGCRGQGCGCNSDYGCCGRLP